MRKLLIGAMMASLFMMGSDANAFSLFGSKKKTTQTEKATQAKKTTQTEKAAKTKETTQTKAASTLKKSGFLSKVMGKSSKIKTENATIYSKQMGKYYEAPAAAVCIQSSGLSSFLSDELKNDLYVKNAERNEPDINAKTSIQNAIKAFTEIYKYMRKILNNEELLAKANAEKTIDQLRNALLALVGTGEEQNKPSKFWKYFGNHIRYSLIVMRNSFNMLLYPKEYWNVGAVLFSANDGTRGANGEKYSTNYHMGSLNYTDPETEIDENSPILAFRDGLTALVDELIEAEIGSEATRKLQKQDRNERLSRSSSRSQMSINEMGDFSSKQDLRGKKTTGLQRSASASNLRKKDASIDDDDYSMDDVAGSDRPIDEDAYANAWMDEEEDVTDPRPSGRYYR